MTYQIAEISDFILTPEITDEIRQFRHQMRSLGQRGACYEVSQFVQWRFGIPSQEGVYQTASGEPICLHRWNILPSGDIVDGTADQFCEGHDVSIICAGSPIAARYRPIWTHVFNPKTIAWFDGTLWTGKPDQEWWQENPDREMSSGWWLRDTTAYAEWRSKMKTQYCGFREKPSHCD